MFIRNKYAVIDNAIREHTKDFYNLLYLFIFKSFVWHVYNILFSKKYSMSIIAFIIVLFGSFNWLSIGFFQYDIVAGLFGFQASIFSRAVYIVIGIAASYLLFSVIKNKGKIRLKQKQKNSENIEQNSNNNSIEDSKNNNNSEHNFNR